jgi:tripartite-type tricarboxylate transporter receptor subunit TctC
VRIPSLVLFVSIGLAFAAPASAQFAGKPITLIVPAGPGSAPDIVARVVGDQLQARLKQPVVVENRSGAGGIIAAETLRRAPADGNTLLLAQAAVVTVTPLTYRAATYDAERDFESVAVVADTPMMFVAHPAKGPGSLADLVGQAKSQPDTIAMSSTSRGSIPNLTAELLALMTGARFNLVAMNASAQALQSVVAGDTVVSVDGIAPLLPQVRAGRLKALGVTADRPLPGLEGLPLAKDTVPGLVATGWFMLFAPKGTPRARIEAVNAAVNEALKAPEVLQKLQATANYPVGGSVAQAQAFLKKEKKLWGDAAQRAGLKRE